MEVKRCGESIVFNFNILKCISGGVEQGKINTMFDKLFFQLTYAVLLLEIMR